jgi:hypothetical protein
VLSVTFSISILLGIFTYFNEALSLQIVNTFSLPQNPENLPIIFFSISLFSLALYYLQSGEKNENLFYDKNDFKELEKKYIDLSVKVDSYESKNTFTEKEKLELKENILKNTTEQTIKNIFNDNVNKLENKLYESLGLDSLKNSFYITIKRISEEIRKLNLRANLSLTIGMIISLGGIYILAQSIEIFSSSSFLTYSDESGKVLKKGIDEILIQMMPRLSFVFIIELFAYFFLRLYKTGLEEIKYFQNELTNIESKLVAVEVSYITKNEESMKIAIDTLVQTERNFVLKKGETTVELEKAKSESEITQNILKAIPAFLKKKG